MFPNSHDCPPRLFQCHVIGPVSQGVPSKLLEPIRAIRLWDASVFRASVPEAAVNEDGQSLLREDYVRPAPSGSGRHLDVLPESVAKPMEPRSQRLFRACVRPSVSPHYFRDLGARGKGVINFSGFQGLETPLRDILHSLSIDGNAP